MKEIKFRAWDGKKMLNNVGFHPFIIQALWRDKDNAMKESDDGAYLISPSFTQYKLMQFTGLHDFKGREIYEGDVVGLPYVSPMGGIDDHYDPQTVYPVVFENGEFALKRPQFNQPLSKWLKKQQGDYIPNFGHRTIVTDFFYGEVIGNIYENPELLEESHENTT